MSIFAIADLHLDGGQSKAMDIFGKNWENHWQKIRENWRQMITEEDTVLIAGDISWAMLLSDAKNDLEEIGELPGKVVFIKGNHDFWHDSLTKTRNTLPKSMYLIQNDAYHISEDLAIAGTRGWKQRTDSDFTADDEKIYLRELNRLKMSLDKTKGKRTIVMMHYPPYSLKREATEFTELIAQYNVEAVVFGHIHGFTKSRLDESQYFDTELDGIPYYLTSCDYLSFAPLMIKN